MTTEMNPISQADLLFAELAAPSATPTGPASPADLALARGQADEAVTVGPACAGYETTMAELEHLARYWARAILWSHLERFLYGQEPGSGWETRGEAGEHLARLEAVLGDAGIRAAWRDIRDEARRQLGAETWRIWTSGSPAERARVADETLQSWDDLDRKRADGATQARAVEHLRADPSGY